MSASDSNVSILRAFLAWCRDNIRQRGLLPSAVFFLQEIRDFVQDSTPERRRQRYGDVDYDWEHRVDTTQATVSFRNRLLGVFHSAYQPTDPVTFREMIGSLPIDYSQFTFIDLGSGKGRTLLMASDYPFQRVIGVELLPELNAIADENIAKFKGGVGDRVESICRDACAFDFLADPIVLFLFNPFPQHVLQKVLANLAKSLKSRPRPVYLIYHNAVLESVVTAQTGIKLFRKAEQYSIFVTDL